MIRQPLGIRINAVPDPSLRDQIREVAALGARGVVLDATRDLSPERLSTTGRRELRQLLRSVELSLIALSLPTRRPFDTIDQLEDRLARADRAFAMAYELGTRLVLARVGAVPGDSDDAARRETFEHALNELGRRADHRGVRLAIETGSEPGAVLRAFLDRLGIPSLSGSVDPGALLRMGHDPVITSRELGHWVAHAYATDATGPGGRGLASNPRGLGYPPGALDWEEYLGSLEEIDYRGFLTVWADPGVDQIAHFRAIKGHLDRF